MRLEQFFEMFALFADAPNAVPRMRRFILDLAVRGRLVAQDSKDEPAVALLEQVQAEKVRLVKSGEIKKQEQLPPVAEDAIPFLLPNGWKASQLGNVAVCLDYKREPINGTERDLRIAGKPPSELFPYYGATQQQGWIDNFIFDAELVLLGEDGVPFFDELRPKAYLISGKTWVNNHAHVFRGILVSNTYLMHWLNTFDYTGRVAGSTRSKLNQAKAVDIPIALPPLAEQKRIVAKVDELMALCDRLEAQQRERDTRHATLARASLIRFAEAPTPVNLDFLFHPSCPITPTDLRKAILSLAVQGKLVAQEPNDELAETSLSRLGLKCMLDPVNGSDQSDDSLPPSWTRVRFEDVALVAGGVTLGRKLGARKTVSLPYLRVANVKRGEIDLSVVKEVSIAEDEIERYALRENDLLMTEGGDWDKVGRAAIWKAQIPLCLHQNHVFRARMRSTEIEPVWFERYFNSPDGRRYFESASKQTTNLASINMRQVRGCPVPFPPLAEQRRIVAKVDQLMAMVEQLEAQLAEAKSRSTALLDAVIHELLNPSAEIVDLAAYRAAMACYAIRKMAAKPYFGRTAAAKVLYLAQAHVGLELGLKPLRDAAGPLDPWIYDFEKDGAREDWFRFSESTTTSGKKKITYQPGRMIAEQSALAERLLSARQRKEYDRLLALFADKTTEEAEIIATLFAAWNDFLIDGHSPGDEQVVTEVREHWHEKKARFAPAQLRQWLAWLRQNNLVPTGRLPHTVHQPQLLLN